MELKHGIMVILYPEPRKHELLDGRGSFLINIWTRIYKSTIGHHQTLCSLKLKVNQALGSCHLFETGISEHQVVFTRWGGRSEEPCQEGRGRMNIMISWSEFMRVCWEEWTAMGLSLYGPSIKFLGIIKKKNCYSHALLYTLLSSETSLKNSTKIREVIF